MRWISPSRGIDPAGQAGIYREQPDCSCRACPAGALTQPHWLRLLQLATRRLAALAVGDQISGSKQPPAHSSVLLQAPTPADGYGSVPEVTQQAQGTAPSPSGGQAPSSTGAIRCSVLPLSQGLHGDHMPAIAKIVALVFNAGGQHAQLFLRRVVIQRLVVHARIQGIDSRFPAGTSWPNSCR